VLRTRFALGFGATLSLLAMASVARADNEGALGDKGDIIISVDRLMPLLSYEDVKATTQGNPTVSASIAVTSISLVGHGGTESLYNIPRLAFDYAVIPHLTIGGSVYVFTQAGNSSTVTIAGTSTTTYNAKATEWGIAPRVGYVIGLGHDFAFWPRAGVSFNDASHTSGIQVGTTQVNGSSATEFALDLEPMFVYTPFSHVGITAAPTLDIPLAGSVSVPAGNNLTSSASLTELQIGLHVGLLIHF